MINSSKLFKIKNNEAGFSLLESVFTLVVVGVIMGFAGEIMVKQADTYLFINNRKSGLSDITRTLSAITKNLETITVKDTNGTGTNYLSGAGYDCLYYKDKDGIVTGFYFKLTKTGYNLYKMYDGIATAEMMKNVKGMTISYYDANGTTLAAAGANEVPTGLTSIELEIKTQPYGKEGAITLSTYITPRSELGYKNFHKPL